MCRGSSAGRWALKLNLRYFLGDRMGAILTWVLVLHFYLTNGHVQVVHPEGAPTFNSRAECEANAPQVRNYIHLWQGEKSFTVGCQQRR